VAAKIDSTKRSSASPKRCDGLSRPQRGVGLAECEVPDQVAGQALEVVDDHDVVLALLFQEVEHRRQCRGGR
jgi:hypothetical protein